MSDRDNSSTAKYWFLIVAIWLGVFLLVGITQDIFTSFVLTFFALPATGKILDWIDGYE